MRISRKEGGGVLVAALMLVLIASGIVAIAVSMTSRTGRLASRTRSQEISVAVGDAYLESAYARWRANCQVQNNALPSGADFTPEKMTAPDASLMANSGTFTVTNFRIQALEGINSGTKNETVWGNGQPQVVQQSADATENSYLYLASADVSVPGLGGAPVVSKVRRVFEKRVESPWKYAIFFNDTLELHPGAPLTINGWVHSNGDTYALADSGGSLAFQDRVTFAGKYLETFANGDAQRRGYTGPSDPAIKKLAAPTFSPDLPASMDSRKDPFGLTPLQFNTTDANPNNDSYRELIERPAPNFPDPLNPANSDNPRFYYQAGVKILINGNSLTLLDLNGNPLDSKSPSYTAVGSALTLGKSLVDNREGATVGVTDLDLSALQSATRKISTWNGILYISDVSASQTGGAPKRAIRLKNGGVLPDGGLTVVSDNPVYIQGDYNSSPTQWQPAAVLGDCVNILSNAWSDANSGGSLASRVASDTTVNTAFLSGVVPTTANPNVYSGGVENFPRFLENWGGKTLTYNGSMVEIFQSKQAVGIWGKSNVYSAPIRKWAFDTRLRTSPPPGVFIVVSYSRGRWYME
jgi:hypothetical protein